MKEVIDAESDGGQRGQVARGRGSDEGGGEEGYMDLEKGVQWDDWEKRENEGGVKDEEVETGESLDGEMEED